MYMPTTDYNQQLVWYLQNWRQLLEQWAAMAAGAPFLTAPPMPPGPFMPFMPAFGGMPVPAVPPMPVRPPMPPPPAPAPAPAPVPVAPTPPAPGDYAQQLFSHLQAWRQYLEQATAAAGTPQPGSAQQPAARRANAAGASGRPDASVPPDGATAGNGALESDERTESGPIPPPKLVDRAPSHFHQSQLSAIRLDPTASPFDDPGERFEMPDPVTLSARPQASRSMVEPVPRTDAGSAFISAMQRVGPVAEPPAAPVSLFSTPDVSASLRDGGENPSL